MSLSTTQSRDSLSPVPVRPEQRKMAQSRALILERPSTSLTSLSVAVSGMSILLARTSRGTPCSISF